MKKLLSLLLAAAMVLSLCACGEKSVPVEEQSIYAQISGFNDDDVLVTINDARIDTRNFMYWGMYTCSTLEYYLMYYSMSYGYEDAFDAEGNLNWSYELEDGITLSDMALEETLSTLMYYEAARILADKYDIQASEEQIKEVDAQMESMKAELGEDGWADYIKETGLTEEELRNMSILASRLNNMDALAEDPGSQFGMDINPDGSLEAVDAVEAALQQIIDEMKVTPAEKLYTLDLGTAYVAYIAKLAEIEGQAQ